MASRESIVGFLDKYLDIAKMDDSSLNGLQVEGSEKVNSVGLAVDASLATYRAAVDAGCEMLVVHHGLLWGEKRRITGSFYSHFEFLIKNRLNLYGVHLPLDAHNRVGNNAQLAEVLKLKQVQSCFEYHGAQIGCRGILQKSRNIGEIAVLLHQAVGGTPIVLPFGPEKIKSVGIVSGGGGSSLAEAVKCGLDCFITGEPVHWGHHYAKEEGINVIFGGHYHTETLGVKAVGKILEKEFPVKTVFIDLPTLV